MSVRELVVLGTASQAPTRERGHNGYLLLWDGEGVLFDPGEGTQRQLIHAGVAAPRITRICVTHFHGDHCLGLPGIVQRLALDGVTRPIHLHYPAGGGEHVDHLLRAAVYHETIEVVRHPSQPGDVAELAGLRLLAERLDHRVETLGWRLEEPDGATMLPERLAEAGVEGPAIGRLQAEGVLDVGGRRVTLEEVSVPRPGQVFAFVMDTRLTDGAFALAEGADMLVCEATFLDRDAHLAHDYGHLTAGQAATIAAEAGVRHLVLTHFSQRYTDPGEFLAEAAAVFDGEITVAADLDRLPLPPRRRP